MSAGPGEPRAAGHAGGSAGGPGPHAPPDRPAYLLGGTAPGAAERMAALAAVFDGWTRDHLARVGLQPGWRCWEVGAGGPSVARWLASGVAPDGHVVATDVDVTWLAGITEPNVTVLRHDVTTERPPALGLDLVHARLLLVHLPDRSAALRAMAGALRPGGWLVVEDADPGLQPRSSLDPAGPADDLANRLREGFRALLAERGADLAFGRTLPRRLRELGLRDVQADAYLPLSVTACATIESATVAMLRDELVRRGVATEAEIDDHLRAVAAGQLDLAQPPLVTAWGRRPGG